MEHRNLLGTLIYEKRTLNYDVANRNFAKIEILDFLDGSFAAQAEILTTGEKVAIGATALWAFTRPTEKLQPLTMWHLVTVLPLVFHDTSRKMILKRREASGLRSILDRDPANSVGQNETIFNINSRLMAMEERTFRSLN